jgi:hypothetical protein
VIGLERAVDWVTERFEGVDAAYRRDVALTTAEVCREASPCRRWVELLGLVGLGLRLRSHARTRDRPDAVWSQGVHLGAVLVLIALAAGSAATATGPADGAVAVLILAAAVLAVRGERFTPAGLIASGVVVECVWVASGAQAGAFVACGAVAAAGVLAGSPATSRRSAPAIAAVTAVAIPCVSALVVGSGLAETLVRVAFVWVLPFALGGFGWFDPRLAAAVTIVVFARLVASGFGELGHALTALEQGGQRDLLARWVLMGIGVVAAWLVTDRSIRRLTRL